MITGKSILTQLSDDELVSKFSQTNQIFFGELFNRYFREVYNRAVIKVKSDDDAFCITMGTFQALFTIISELKTPQLFKIYLNKYLDFELQSFFQNHSDEVLTKDLFLKVKEAEEKKLQSLDNILVKLDDAKRQLFIDKYQNGKSMMRIRLEMGLLGS